MALAATSHSTFVACADLARALPRLHDMDTALDAAWVGLGSKSAFAAREAALAHIMAVEDLVLATPAVTLADAAAQILVAAFRARWLLAGGPGDPAMEEVDRGLHSALLAVAAAGGVDLRQLGLEHYGLEVACRCAPPVAMAA